MTGRNDYSAEYMIRPGGAGEARFWTYIDKLASINSINSVCAEPCIAVVSERESVRHSKVYTISCGGNQKCDLKPDDVADHDDEQRGNAWWFDAGRNPLLRGSLGQAWDR